MRPRTLDTSPRQQCYVGHVRSAASAIPPTFSMLAGGPVEALAKAPTQQNARKPRPNLAWAAVARGSRAVQRFTRRRTMPTSPNAANPNVAGSGTAETFSVNW